MLSETATHGWWVVRGHYLSGSRVVNVNDPYSAALSPLSQCSHTSSVQVLTHDALSSTGTP